MGAFTDLDDFVNRMTGGNSGAPENLFFHKNTSYDGGTLIATNSVVGYTSAWRWDGIPNAGAVAAAVAACDKTTVGALQFTNSAGSAVKRLVQASLIHGGLSSNGAMAAQVSDRLLACGGLSGTVTTAQTVGGSIGRYTGGIGNQIWIEIQTAIGGTTSSITASYTNENGTAGQTTIPHRFGNSGLSEVHVAMQLPLAGGDLGVRSVQSVTLTPSTGTAGNFACVIYHPLALLFGPGVGLGPFGSLGANTEIVDDACITFLLNQGSNRLSFGGLLCGVDV